jgi:phage N-6-adenine-methyltransferase
MQTGRAYRRRLKQSVHFSSATTEWGTPRELFESLDSEFSFTLDACASAENAKCVLYFDKAQDGLRQTWNGSVWMNPPYGRAIGRWMQKAADSTAAGATVVCLAPARTDTTWWHSHCAAAEVRFLRGRITFEGASSGSEFGQSWRK